mmetsp:Transcript_39798/g.73896  ORF Transcript_39798/g.73896 Transcript_39798/m.73896 type:complete len:712 (-) Transcript_39798:129-2264(-)
MKFTTTFILMTLCTGVAEGAVANQSSTPVAKVVNLLRSLKAEIETDGKLEQQIYDKYACWVDDAKGRKTATITKAQADIAAAQALITKLAAEIATGTASIANLADDIADNKAAQKDAFDKREAEKAAYLAENKEAVATHGALGEAIKVLDQTGTGALIEKAKFLGVIQQTQVLSVVGGLRKVLKNAEAVGSISQDDLSVLKDFVAKPSDFFGKPRASMSATQVSQHSLVANNPFGDYAPQSTRIQGILKGMYDAFTASIGKAMEEEAAAVKAYNELSATRMKELGTLETTKLTEEASTASKKENKAETEAEKKASEETLAAAEAFLEDTVKNARAEAAEWSERSRLRSEELVGIAEAIGILTTQSAKTIFNSSHTTFMQVSSVSVTGAEAKLKREKAYKQLQKLATRLHSMQVAKIAASVKLGGPFDQVIAMIDKMMELLRKEEAADLFHRDRCQSSQNANRNELEDLNSDITKASTSLARMGDEITQLQTDIQTARDEISNTKTEMDTALGIRNDEHAQFVKALKDDTDAIALLEAAIASLSKYWIGNKLSMGGLLQRDHAPEYAQDIDVAPENDYSSGSKYSSQTGGIVSILHMIKEDLEKEVTVARQEEGVAQSDFDAAMAKLQAQIDTLEDIIAALEAEEAATMSASAAMQLHKTAKEADEDTENELKGTLYSDCLWVQTHFSDRYAKRKTEMKGLTDAKAYLSGIM